MFKVFGRLLPAEQYANTPHSNVNSCLSRKTVTWAALRIVMRLVGVVIIILMFFTIMYTMIFSTLVSAVYTYILRTRETCN